MISSPEEQSTTHAKEDIALCEILVSHIDTYCEGIDIDSILNFFQGHTESAIIKTLRYLSTCKRVVTAGGEHIVYVTPRYAEKFMVQPQLGLPIFAPKMWLNFYGEEVMYVKKCISQMVLSRIIASPGITESELGPIFICALSKLELNEILSDMESQGCVKSMILDHDYNATFYFSQTGERMHDSAISTRIHYVAVMI